MIDDLYEDDDLAAFGSNLWENVGVFTFPLTGYFTKTKNKSKNKNKKNKKNAFTLPQQDILQKPKRCSTATPLQRQDLLQGAKQFKQFTKFS